MQYKEISIGLDQSYQMTGICVAADNEVKLLKGIDLSKLKDNTSKRKELQKILEKLIVNLKKRTNKLVILIERIRLRSGGFLNINYIKSIGALNAMIVDTAHKYGIDVYSVDTRSWKARVIGNIKPEENDFGVDEKKWPTVEHVIKAGFEENILIEIITRKRKNTFVRDGKRWMYNDDVADSYGIALYWFRGEYDLLEKES